MYCAKNIRSVKKCRVGAQTHSPLYFWMWKGTMPPSPTPLVFSLQIEVVCNLLLH